MIYRGDDMNKYDEVLITAYNALSEYVKHKTANNLAEYERALQALRDYEDKDSQ